MTPDEACAHPNWVMGRKISVDSATMMNKALEVIEARWLFDLTPEQIQVVIHPQSIIHSMVVCRDDSVLAQLGTPDMRVPIAYGLSFPERIESGAPRLDFATLQSLTFEPPDAARFPGLQLAWDALRAPAGSTAVLNAANEVAVAAFLAGRIRFTGIHAVNARRSTRVQPAPARRHRSTTLLALDAARAVAALAGRCKELGRVITTVLAFLLTLGVLIVIHEYGHYRVAVACGVKVLRFSVGFGRVLWRRQATPQSTEFVLVRAAAGRLRAHARRARGRRWRPAEQRPRLQPQAAAGSAPRSSSPGRLANLLLAVLLYAAAHWIGIDEPKAVLGRRVAGSLAERAGMRAGDWVRALVARRRRLAGRRAR